MGKTHCFVSFREKTSSCIARCLFFFNDTATTEIYTLSLHDALPIWGRGQSVPTIFCCYHPAWTHPVRSEEHTSELQSPGDLVCRLLLEKNNTQRSMHTLLQTRFYGGDVTVRLCTG